MKRLWIAAALSACMLLGATVGVPRARAAAFGIERYDLSASESGGPADTQAGSHPYELTAEISFDKTGSLDDLQLELPPGLTLDANSVQLCTVALFLQNECPNGSAVGVANVSAGGTSYPAAVYDLSPLPGASMRLGLFADGAALLLDASLRPDDYGMTLRMEHAPEVIGLEKLALTLWGVPGDPGHDALRGRCATGGATECPTGLFPAAFVTLPTACAGGLDTTTTALADSWQHEAEWTSDESPFPQMTGCNRLSFAPAVDVLPDVVLVGVPSGYDLQLAIPQVQGPKGLATAQTENASIALPMGTSLSLAATNGLSGCEEAQFAERSSAPSACPESSKVGTVEIVTPLLANPLQGAVYLATPDANPLGALVGLYVVAEEPRSGVTVKLVGRMLLNATTGQPTLAFEDLPQLPIEEIRLHLFGGARALLANPRTCGANTSTAVLAPWSGSATATPSSFFDAIWEQGQRACPDLLPFEPTLRTLPASAPAGSYGSLVLGGSLEGRQQNVSRFSARLPTGLAWMFSSVPPCGEPQAGQGICPSASRVGSAVIVVGFQRLAWFTGSVYLTEGYAGAPHGLSIVFNATAGPLDLGEMVVRAAVGQDPTGALTIASDPLPRILDGIALQTSAFEIAIERNGFVLNSTVCEGGALTASIEGDEGTSAQISSPYAVAGCQSPAATPTPPGNEGSGGGGGRIASSTKPTRHDISRVLEQLRGGHVQLRFTTSVSGSVTIAGQGVRTYIHKLRAGAHEIRLALSKRGSFDVRHHRRTKLELTLRTAGGSIAIEIVVRL